MPNFSRAAIGLALLLAGCAGSAVPMRAAGPAAVDQEHALQIVWEGVYGMTRDTRPAISWWIACPDGHENEGCYDEYSTPGNVNLIWIGTNPTSGAVLDGLLISDTMFSEALEAERDWIVYPPGELAPTAEAERLTRDAQDALRATGL